MNRFFLITLIVITIFTACKDSGKKDPASRVERIPFVENLLAQMTLDEKVGQMAQLTLDVITIGEDETVSDEPIALDMELVRWAVAEYGVGSILNTANNRARTREKWHTIVSQIQEVAINETRLGIPVLYGIDAIHGTTYTAGATFFPQQIGQAATFNPELVRKAAEITAYETRASAIPWTFSPVLDMGRDPRFPRMWETFGEDVYLTTVLGVEMIKGYEGEDNDVSDPFRIASCAKHYLGYSVPVSGKDRTPALIPEIELRERHLPPFQAAVEAGTHTIMVNSGIINGIPVHASYELLTSVLKEELGFTGLLLTDWWDIENLHTRDRIASTSKEAVKLAINAGIDMAMIPYNLDFCDYLIELVNEGEVPMSRIDDAVRRILNTKYKLGLFDTPVTHYSNYPLFGSDEFIQAAYQTAKESITLLKNDNGILPLSKNARVLVTGPNSNSMRALNGGWSYSWQGEKVDEFADEYSTILDAVGDKIGSNRVTFIEGVRYDNENHYWVDEPIDIPGAVRAAAGVDYIIIVLGENSYAEKPGDLHDLTLSGNQINLAKALAETGKPMILVLNQGRPRIIREIEPLMSAVVNAYLPGNYGGLAVADVIFGDYNPGGKLPFTYPMYPNSLFTYDHKPSEHQEKMVGVYDYESDFVVQYSFGFGMSYTTFDYSNLRLSSQNLASGGELEIMVDVENSGSLAGHEVIKLYTSAHFTSVTPDVKRLRRFSKVFLEPGEKKTVAFTIAPEDISFINAQNKRVNEPGAYDILIQELSSTFNFTK